MAKIVCCINIFYLTWPKSPPYLVKLGCSHCYTTSSINIRIRWNVLFATKYLTTELAHSKLNNGYLAELLVVMTDELKIVRIGARNVPRVHGHKAPRRRRVSGISLAPGKRRCRVLMRRGAVPLKHKNRLRTTCACLTVASEQESCRDSMHSSLWH